MAGKEEPYCCSVYVSIRAVGGGHRSRFRVLCSLHAQAHTAASPRGSKKKTTSFFCRLAVTAAAFTRSLGGDRASCVRETRVPSPYVSSPACSRKKRELKRPPPTGTHRRSATRPQKKKRPDFSVDLRFRRCFYTIAARRPHLRRARDTHTTALCVLLCLPAQETGPKTAFCGFFNFQK